MNTSSTDQRPAYQSVEHQGPEQADVDELRHLLDMLEDFSSNDQRARYLLTCNWMRDRGARVSARLAPPVTIADMQAMSIRDALEMADRVGVSATDFIRGMEMLWRADAAEPRRAAETTDAEGI